MFKFQKHRTKTNTRKLQTEKDRNPHLTVGSFWIANRNTGFSIRTVGINTQRITYAKQIVLSFSQSTKACIKSNSQSQSRQPMRPMWMVETMVLPIHIGKHNHAVDRLAQNRRKDIKLLDTKLSVSRGAYSHMFD